MHLSSSKLSPVLLVVASFMSGCSAIEGIFKAGVWVGVVIVVLVGGLAAALLGMFRR